MSDRERSEREVFVEDTIKALLEDASELWFVQTDSEILSARGDLFGSGLNWSNTLASAEEQVAGAWGEVLSADEAGLRDRLMSWAACERRLAEARWQQLVTETAWRIGLRPDGGEDE